MKRISAGKVADFEHLSVRKIWNELDAIAVFYLKGKFYAIEDTCTHAQASLSEGSVEGLVVTCPRHGAKFDLITGETLSLPAVFPVRTYPVVVENEEVFVEVSEKQ